jgi:hypothetical protein
MYPTPSGRDLERWRMRRIMLRPMSGPNGVRVARVLGARVKGVGGLAIIRSIPFGNAAMRISREIVRASLGRAES